jgi:hypothetical protein
MRACVLNRPQLSEPAIDPVVAFRRIVVGQTSRDSSMNQCGSGGFGFAFTIGTLLAIAAVVLAVIGAGVLACGPKIGSVSRFT